MTDMDKIQKDNAEPGKARGQNERRQAASVRHPVRLVDGRQGRASHSCWVLAQYGRVSLGLTEELGGQQLPRHGNLVGGTTLSSSLPMST